MAASDASPKQKANTVTMAVPQNFFVYVKPAATYDNSLYRCLSDSSSDVTSLNVYPNIRKLYISLNTGLPASAAVERLFSLGGRVFSPLRARLSSNHFEMMMFLRCAKFWQWHEPLTALTYIKVLSFSSLLYSTLIVILSIFGKHFKNIFKTMNNVIESTRW